MMRKGVKADSRLNFEELFFDGSFENPLTPEKSGVFRTPLEMVRLAPSAVNKQLWRIVKDGNLFHFYKKRSKGYVSSDGWDTQKIDIGIAMCHFVAAIEELGTTAVLEYNNPNLKAPQDADYIASYRVN